MRKFNVMVIGLCVILSIFFIGLMLYQFNRVDVRRIDMHFQVTDRMGFNTDTDALYFGKGYPGSVTKRQVEINNSYSFPVAVSITVEGDIAQFVSVSENGFILNASGRRYVTYFVETPADTPYGNYSGVTTLIIKRA